MRDAPSFLSLPVELRNQIYEDVFQGWIIAIKPSVRRHDSLEADIYPASTDPYQTIGRQVIPRASGPCNLLGLLYTCRQIYAEARLLPYSLNIFYCGESPVPQAWLHNLHEQLAQIRSLHLCSYMPANITLSRTWLEVLDCLTGLRKVAVFWQVQVPPWGQEEDHLSTALQDEAEMKRRITKATSAACDVVFHRIVVLE